MLLPALSPSPFFPPSTCSVCHPSYTHWAHGQWGPPQGALTAHSAAYSLNHTCFGLSSMCFKNEPAYCARMKVYWCLEDLLKDEIKTRDTSWTRQFTTMPWKSLKEKNYIYIRGEDIILLSYFYGRNISCTKSHIWNTQHNLFSWKAKLDFSWTWRIWCHLVI